MWAIKRLMCRLGWHKWYPSGRRVPARLPKLNTPPPHEKFSATHEYCLRCPRERWVPGGGLYPVEIECHKRKEKPTNAPYRTAPKRAMC